MINLPAHFKVSAVQMNSQSEKIINLKQAEDLISQIVELENPQLVCLPETFDCLGGGAQHSQKQAEAFPDGEAYNTMANIAKKYNIWLHAGSMHELAGERWYNSSVVFNNEGQEVAKYRKIHLFDVAIPGGPTFKESDRVAPGDIRTITYDLPNGLRVGCAICYDLRFPELFQNLREKGAHIVVIPSAFTLQTGMEHWEVLLRARAIENQCFIIAPNQTGQHDNGKRSSYGHTMIVDPWGQVIARRAGGIGTVTSRLDIEYLQRIRTAMPVQSHKIQMSHNDVGL
ncbi:MAG: carbon-nitrogen hydrolase family protein [Alphaproteobacteria bacterium]